MQVDPGLNDAYEIGFDCNLRVTVGELRALIDELEQLKANIAVMRDGYADALKERDTLREVLSLLAPDLKTMAILYQQQGQTDRAQALNNICKSVGVV